MTRRLGDTIPGLTINHVALIIAGSIAAVALAAVSWWIIIRLIARACIGEAA